MPLSNLFRLYIEIRILFAISFLDSPSVARRSFSFRREFEYHYLFAYSLTPQ